MRSIKLLPAGLAATILLVCAPLVEAHTWVDQLTVIASNGTFVGAPGYIRGYVTRYLPDNTTPNPAFADTANQNELPTDGRPTGNAILPTDLMCRSTQTIGTQTAGRPALIASPGDHVALRYQENGHVTFPQVPPGKPLGGGIIFVYGTSKPSNDDTYLGIHRVWNSEGTGGDGRGELLATRPFDDGQCWQNNTGPISQTRQKQFPHTSDTLMGENLWCQTDVQLPAKVTDSYTLYWVWEWPTLDSAGNVFTNQSYTSCMDITIKSPGNSAAKAEDVNFIKGQDLNRAAIADQLATPFLINPTAAQQTFPGATGVPPAPSNVAPAVPPAATSVAPTVPPAQSTTTSSQAASGFTTVTVTAPKETVKETIYVTVTASAEPTSSEMTSSSTTVTSTSYFTVTVSPIPVSSVNPVPEPSNTDVASGPPTIIPFLSPESKTLGLSQTTPQPTLAATATQTSALAPPTSIAYSNGTVATREYKLRGRSVRL